jgi:hypothetical protein
MKNPPPLAEICRLLSEYIGAPLQAAGAREPEASDGWDAMLQAQGASFLVAYKPGAGAEAVGGALRQIREHAPPKPRSIPLLVVPYMGEVGKELCRKAGVAWLDLSGNAQITTPRLRIVVDGKPNLYVQRGRPSDPFAPKASRITRMLLLDPGVAWSQSELVRKTAVDKGFVSRTVQRLEQAGFVARDESGLVRATAPGELLAAWRAAYDFSRHDITRAVIAARSGPDVLSRASGALRRMDVRHAATGLAAAWVYEPFAAYRTATVYVERQPSEATLKALGAREAPSGANLWLVVPNDQGVFAEARDVGGLPCVSPLQTYLDLKGQPERAEEAAEALRRVHLPWASE